MQFSYANHLLGASILYNTTNIIKDKLTMKCFGQFENIYEVESKIRHVQAINNVKN